MIQLETYSTRFNYIPPTQTALIFTGFLTAVDFVMAGLSFNRSLEKFTSLLRTWILFGRNHR